MPEDKTHKIQHALDKHDARVRKALCAELAKSIDESDMYTVDQVVNWLRYCSAVIK